MSKIVFYIIVVVCGQAVLAQKFNGFYIEPLANIKTTTFYKKDLPEEITTQYFSIKPQKNITPLGFNVGINFGYKFNNNNIIQFGFFQDESLSGIDFSGNNVASSSIIGTVGGVKYSHFGGVMTKNINILFKKELINIITKKNIKEPYFSVNFNIGLTYFYKPNNGLENLTGINTLSYNSFDSSYVQFTDIKAYRELYPV